jgi:uncharacterized protein YcbK (DUF882 family)
MTPSNWNRRRVVAALAAGAAALPFAHAAKAARFTAPHPQRWLELVNTHTSEVVSVAFRNAQGFVADSLHRLQHVLRDHRAGAEHPMDTGLYDLLADLAAAAGKDPRFEVISGYRSPDTNAMLHERSNGVATRSLHMQGMAIDVRLKGVDCSRLRDVALGLRRGGVGYYRASDFVHVDTGRVRTWSG